MILRVTSSPALAVTDSTCQPIAPRGTLTVVVVEVDVDVDVDDDTVVSVVFVVVSVSVDTVEVVVSFVVVAEEVVVFGFTTLIAPLTQTTRSVMSAPSAEETLKKSLFQTTGY